jgi:hypothetical protein
VPGSRLRDVTRKRKKPPQNRRPRKATAGPPPETTTAAKPPVRLGAGMVVLCLVIPGAMLLVLVATILDVAMPELGLALDPADRTGTATVLSCVPRQVGSGRTGYTAYDCKARFVFDDRSKEPIVIDTIPDVEVGEAFPAALTPEGDRVLPTGDRGAWRAIMLLSSLPFGVALIAFLSALVMRSKKWIIWTGLIGAPFLIALIAGVVIGT